MKNTTEKNITPPPSAESISKVLSPQENKLFNIIASGGTWSGKQIMAATKERDPRSTIRRLRNKGVIVADKWVRDESSRFKHYFVHTGS